MAGLLCLGSSLPGKTSRVAASPTTTAPTDSCWVGNLAGRIPVLVHYQRDGEIVVGEITYLNTKHKTPIRLLGTVTANKTYRLLEFDQAGTITGIITSHPVGRAFTGQWSSPTTGRELPLQLARKDMRMVSAAIRADPAHLSGTYFYRYGVAGRQGTFTLTRLASGRASFELVAVTDAPARNIADVPLDTVNLAGTAFTYAVAETDNCAFQVRFYKDFMVVRYTKGDCAVQFGHNATAEGIFIKTE